MVASFGVLHLAVLALPGVATSLRTARSGPATAVCVAGNARTLAWPGVAKSLERFVKELDGVDLQRDSHPDVFSYITLEGAPPKGQAGWNFEAAHSTEGEVAQALLPLAPVKNVTTPISSEVTSENIDEYVVNRKECFSSGYYGQVSAGLERTLNQLVHWQRCLDLVVEEEQRSGKQYEAVIITRPDMTYLYRPIDLASVKLGDFVCQKDWVMAMPRRVAGLLLSKERARPLSCGVGEPCCGKVGQSEVLWEYLMGARVDNRGSCDCGPSSAESGPIRMRTDAGLGRIVRPARSDE